MTNIFTLKITYTNGKTIDDMAEAFQYRNEATAYARFLVNTETNVQSVTVYDNFNKGIAEVIN